MHAQRTLRDLVIALAAAAAIVGCGKDGKIIAAGSKDDVQYTFQTAVDFTRGSDEIEGYKLTVVDSASTRVLIDMGRDGDVDKKPKNMSRRQAQAYFLRFVPDSLADYKARVALYRDLYVIEDSFNVLEKKVASRH
jgi:hypothetical protein